jgi:hypothetical protein
MRRVPFDARGDCGGNSVCAVTHCKRRIRQSNSIPRLLRSLRCLLFRKQKETEQTERAKKGIQFPHQDLIN